MLKPGGVFFATYILPTNLYHKFIVSKEGDLSKVVLKGRERATYFLNFKTTDEVIEIFNIFNKLHTGFYTHTLSEIEGPSDHMIYIGIKK